MLKVIYILGQPSAYEIYNPSYRPPVYFTRSDGNWIGVWDNALGNKLGHQIVKYSKEIQFEFWRLDYRADKIYQHTFEDGLVNRIFPARPIKIKTGVAERVEAFSDELLQELKTLSSIKPGNVVLHLGNKGELLKAICEHTPNLSKIGSFRGTINLPQNNLLKIRKDFLSYFYLIKEYKERKKTYAQLDAITYLNDYHLKSLKCLYKGKLRKQVLTGVDFSRFVPGDKTEARHVLNLPENKKIILSVSRLNGNKQIDKLIEVLLKMRGEHDFFYIVLGHGTREYENYLKQLAAPLIASGNILFPGYVAGDLLVKYYQAADLFFMSSKEEGNPITSVEAMACETPVLTTKTGSVAEILASNEKDVLFGMNDYSKWKSMLVKLYRGDVIDMLDRSVVQEYFSWPAVASNLLNLYKNVQSSR